MRVSSPHPCGGAANASPPLRGSSMAPPTPATGPTETWLSELEPLQQSLESLLRLLGSLSFQVKDTGKRKKMVLHALSNQDLPDMKELPDSSDGLRGLLQLLNAQLEQTEERKKVASLSVRLKELGKKKESALCALSKKVNNATSVASEKESDAHLCFYPALLCLEKLPHSIEDLLGLLGSLTLQLEGLENKKQVVLLALSKFYNATNVVSEKKSYACPTMEDVLLVFVEEIEKANQYFDFEEFLKKDNLAKPGDDAYVVLKHLVYEQKVHESPQFNKLDFQQILDAIDSCIRNLKIERHAHRGLMQGNNSSEAFPKTENDWYSLMWPQEDYVGRLVKPILSLVYYIREKGHVMDENPLVELSYIINFSDMFYKLCIFRKLLQKYSENSVSVHIPSPDFEEDNIKAELSVWGEIKSFRFERSETSGARTAHVTFENSVAAKIAPLFAGRKVEGRKLRFSIEPIMEEYEYRPKETAEYRRAMTKYEEFRNYSKKMSK